MSVTKTVCVNYIKTNVSLGNLIIAGKKLMEKQGEKLLNFV